MKDIVSSFGNYPKVQHNNIYYLNWLDDDINFSDNISILPYGLGKSYGDSCLNSNNNLIVTRNLNRLIEFDNENGQLTVESGITLEECLEFLIPRGWFLPVTPGTKLITVGGALANDVHGKNHHKAGSFGNHVLGFELLRSDGTLLWCSEEKNSDLFFASIGGIGLTGLITKIKFRNIRCNSTYIQSESIKFKSLEEFLDLSNESENFEYSVSWLDTNNLDSGIFSRGNFILDDSYPSILHSRKKINIPFNLDFINPLTVKTFNTLYYSKQFEKKSKNIIHYDSFFYPLDKINNWNKFYGKKGFLQYQFVIPFESVNKYLSKILKSITSFTNSSFLTVIKTFGQIKSRGLMSFPMEGVTVAIDFKFTGFNLLKRLDYSDKLVAEAGGRVYIAKDARMSQKAFMSFYPNHTHFTKFIDNKFSSDFWRRVSIL